MLSQQSDTRTRFRDLGLGFRRKGLGFRDWGLGFGDLGLEFRLLQSGKPVGALKEPFVDLI